MPLDASSSGSQGGSALLLRLFESNFFDVHLCVGYLKTYPNSIGITHYLVNRLKRFDVEDVEFYWPQLCYLVISRPTPSVALENFILERCENDAHIAVITLWYLQSSLSDLSDNPSSESFAVCRRLLNRAQAIIFTDPPVPDTTNGSSTVSGKPNKRPVNAPLAALVGLGMLAAAIAQPRLASTCGNIAIEQGRRIEDVSRDTSSEAQDDSDGSTSEDESSGKATDSRTQAQSVATPATASAKLALLGRNVLTGRPSAPSRSRSVASGSQPSPNYLPGDRIEASPSIPITSRATTSHTYLPPVPALNIPGLSSPRPGPGPGFGRKTSSGASASVPSLLSNGGYPHPRKASPSPSSSTAHLSGSTSPGYGLPREFLSRILLLQACRSQLDLLRSLQDISTRLVLVPKPARLSSLRAELTVLNHGLPRGCSLGMSSRVMDSTSSKKPISRTLARIVRIAPSESVVLNSADRAPFVIHVEILEGDLDFDPDRRQNAEDLRRALKERDAGPTHTVNRSRPPATPVSSDMKRGSSLGSSVMTTGADSVAGDMSFAEPTTNGVPAIDVLEAPREPREEMDLVEQLYGDTPLRNELPEPEEEEPSIQNKQVDEQAWARGSTPEPNSTPRKIGLQESKKSSSPAPVSSPARPAISLDDYAERMRMAAVMLAQLDASQQATKGVVATGTAAAGTLVGLPVATVAGIGGAVGAGIGAVASRLPGARSRSGPSIVGRVNTPPPAGQATAGTTVSLDTSTAAEGTSAVSGQAPAPGSAPGHRPRLLTNQEATMIRERIMSEMMALEEERMARMREDGRARRLRSGTEDGSVVMRAVNKDDPSGAVLSESFAAKTARIRAASPYGHLPNWNVISVIVKTGADLRQEQFAVQLIKEFGRIWQEEKCPSWVCYFRMLVTSEQSGLIETITDAVSIHSIKKDAYARTAADGTRVFESFTLYDYYIDKYGPLDSATFRRAQDAFCKSLASYSVICYLLQLKDRHNGNILVDREGHLIHIDFGFILSNSPGSIGFEQAPFKLPQDYIDILGGYDGDKYREFKTLFKRNFRDARKHAERIITLVELMQKDSKLPCFSIGEQTSQQLRDRFMLSLTQAQAEEFCEKLIISAATSSFTRLYDLFQGYSNGIL